MVFLIIVADLSILLALMASRNGRETMAIVQNGRASPQILLDVNNLNGSFKWPDFTWSPFAFCGPQLSTTPSFPTRKIGFLGFGRIAQATLARLIPFGITHCLYTSNPTSRPDVGRDEALAKKYNLKSVKRVDVDDLARESDVIFVLTIGGEKTKHLVNEEFLKKMKKTSLIVNTSRGTVVDSDALAKALREGWIWSAALDVVEGEPNVTADHPLVKEPRFVKKQLA
jgi:glyoxylate/hydroxypyruvate reductase